MSNVMTVTYGAESAYYPYGAYDIIPIFDLNCVNCCKFQCMLWLVGSIMYVEHLFN